MNKYSEQYLKKPENYFTNIRYDIIKLIDSENSNILELGCGKGNTLLQLKQEKKAKFIAGIDIVDFGQRNKLDRFILADVENEEIDLPKDYFDIIICADVLEHLKDPWNVMKKLRSLLKDDGIIIASIPNIREFKTLFNIIVRGDFKYVDAGILDKTHLRFFCKKNILELFEQAGFEVIRIEKSPYTFSKKAAFVNIITLRLFEDFFISQYIIFGRKLSAVVSAP